MVSFVEKVFVSVMEAIYRGLMGTEKLFPDAPTRVQTPRSTIGVEFDDDMFATGPTLMSSNGLMYTIGSPDAMGSPD
jgi:hypothetical protein